VYFTSTSCMLNVAGGIADCGASAGCVSSINKIRISSYLQKSSSGSWVTLKHWTQDTRSNSASFRKTYAVTSGSYRHLCYIYAYIGEACMDGVTKTAYDSY